MVNKRTTTLTNEEYESESVMAEMRDAMYTLRLHNQALEDKVFHIQQR